jgi:hypothetical protein
MLPDRTLVPLNGLLISLSIPFFVYEEGKLSPTQAVAPVEDHVIVVASFL